MSWLSRFRSGGWRRLSREDAGQAIVWVAVMLPLFLSIVGLAIDGGIVFSARRELQNVADGAARAGAMQIDERAYRESAGQRLVLDTDGARQAASAYLSRQRGSVTAEVMAAPDVVVVAVRRDVPTTFLQLVGIQSAPISATSSASPRHGIEGGNR